MKNQFPEELDILGVRILDLSMTEALARLVAIVEGPADHSRSVFFPNASTLNIAAENPDYRAILNGADYAFGDGTGVRWAARYIHGIQLRDNVNGTDLVPQLLTNTSGRGYRYYMLGATPDASIRAARRSQELFPGWQLAGSCHGYFEPSEEAGIVEAINAANPQLLLVGMGNPRQESFIDRNLHRLAVPLCLGVGGLFTYWAGDLKRAPAWMRRFGFEWVHLLISQPHKFKRYVIGNPVFLGRMLTYRQRKQGG